MRMLYTNLSFIRISDPSYDRDTGYLEYTVHESYPDGRTLPHDTYHAAINTAYYTGLRHISPHSWTTMIHTSNNPGILHFSDGTPLIDLRTVLMEHRAYNYGITHIRIEANDTLHIDTRVNGPISIPLHDIPELTSTDRVYLDTHMQIEHRYALIVDGTDIAINLNSLIESSQPYQHAPLS